MGRPKQDPVKAVARAILALTVEQRNALDVALEIYEEVMNGGAKPTWPTATRTRKPKSAPEPSNG